MTSQVVIIGAGPGGAATAIALAQRGVTDVLLIDRARFPRDKTCGSAISPLGLRVLEELGVQREVAERGYPIHSLLLTTPGGRRLRLAGQQAATILLRKQFDALLTERAQALGVAFRDGCSVTGLIEGSHRVLGVRIGTEEIHADCVVCADGASSRFAPAAPPPPADTLATIMGWWEDFPFEPGELEMVFDRAVLPLYGWMFPETPSRVNIGIVVDAARVGRMGDLGSVRTVFEAFLQRHYAPRLSRAQPVGRWCGHPIAHSTWVRHGGRPGVLYVGEAVRLTNAATGEGIYQAMRSGVYAADAIASVARGAATEVQAWRQYRRRCRRTFTPGFVLAHAFRGAVRIGALDAVARAFSRPHARRLAAWALGSALTADFNLRS